MTYENFLNLLLVTLDSALSRKGPRQKGRSKVTLLRFRTFLVPILKGFLSWALKSVGI